jgi:hypothetical protein
MTKLLNGIHILVFSILLLSAVSDAVLLFHKMASPSSELVRYWRPGSNYLTIPLRLLLLAPILAYSIRLLKGLSLRTVILLTVSWLICLTWVGWFGSNAWFGIYDLHEVDWRNASVVYQAIRPQLIWHILIYLVIVWASIIPIMLRWWELRRNNLNIKEQGVKSSDPHLGIH